MGYSPTLRLLEQNEDLLESILLSAEKNNPLSLSFRPEDLGVMHYRINRILHSAQIFSTFQGGRYSKLRKLVSIKIDPENSIIRIVPTKLPIEEVRRTFEDALLDLAKEEASEFSLIEFFPPQPLDLSTLEPRISELGWTLHPTTLVESEDGSISIAVSRKEEKKESGFSLLSRKKSGD